MAHEITRQRRARRRDDRLDGVDHGDAGQVAYPVRSEVGLGKHRHHAGEPTRRVQTDSGDPREGVRRADHMGVQHISHVIISDIGPAPGEEAMILQPVQGLTLVTLAQPLTSLPKHRERLG